METDATPYSTEKEADVEMTSASLNFKKISFYFIEQNSLVLLL